MDSDDSFGDIDPGNVDLGLKLKNSHSSKKSRPRGLSLSSDDSPTRNILKGRVTHAQLQRYADDEDETDDLEEVILEKAKGLNEMSNTAEGGKTDMDESEDDGLSLENLSLRSAAISPLHNAFSAVLNYTRLQRLQSGEDAFPLTLSDSSSQSPSDDAHSHSSTGDDEAEDWGDAFEGDIDISALKRLNTGSTIGLMPLST